MSFLGKIAITTLKPSNSSKIQMLGVYWKIQDICYQMGAEIFKTEEEMTEKTKHKVANLPSKNGQNSLLTICSPLMSLCIFMTCNESKTCSMHMLVEGKIKVVLYPWLGVSSSRTLMP